MQETVSDFLSKEGNLSFGTIIAGTELNGVKIPWEEDIRVDVSPVYGLHKEAGEDKH